MDQDVTEPSQALKPSGRLCLQDTSCRQLPGDLAILVHGFLERARQNVIPCIEESLRRELEAALNRPLELELLLEPPERNGIQDRSRPVTLYLEELSSNDVRDEHHGKPLRASANMRAGPAEDRPCRGTRPRLASRI